MRKKLLRKCCYRGCWEKAVGMYCPAHSSSYARGWRFKKKGEE